MGRINWKHDRALIKKYHFVSLLWYTKERSWSPLYFKLSMNAVAFFKPCLLYAITHSAYSSCSEKTKIFERKKLRRIAYNERSQEKVNSLRGKRLYKVTKKGVPQKNLIFPSIFEATCSGLKQISVSVTFESYNIAVLT